jgi:ubiquinone/menaquinone biosynthesis C-methylase UbiE
MALGMREQTFRAELSRLVFSTGHRPDVLDVGAGTGTLAITLAEEGAHVTAVEPDPAALARARNRSGAGEVAWVAGRADALPMPDESADRVVLSLVLHHLSDEDKDACLREAHRALRPDGRLVVAEWTAPGDPVMALAFRGLQVVDGRDTTALLGQGRLPGLVAAAGFTEIEQHLRLRTAFGRLAIHSARRARSVIGRTT